MVPPHLWLARRQPWLHFSECSQSSTRKPGTSLKSLEFDDNRIAPCSKAMLAIFRSMVPIRTCCCRRSRNRAAAFSSKRSISHAWKKLTKLISWSWSDFAGDVSRTSDAREPTAHVFLERNNGGRKMLVRRSVHISRQRFVGSSLANLNNVEMIRVEKDHTSPWSVSRVPDRSSSRIRCVSL